MELPVEISALLRVVSWDKCVAPRCSGSRHQPNSRPDNSNILLLCSITRIDVDGKFQGSRTSWKRVRIIGNCYHMRKEGKIFIQLSWVGNAEFERQLNWHRGWLQAGVPTTIFWNIYCNHWSNNQWASNWHSTVPTCQNLWVWTGSKLSMVASMANLFWPRTHAEACRPVTVGNALSEHIVLFQNLECKAALEVLPQTGLES